MHKAHYWLLLHIAKAPKAVTYGAGMLIAVIFILATAITVFMLDRNRVAAQHHAAFQSFRVMTAESMELLEHLVEHGDLDCDNDDLIHLNAHLLQSRYIREIGMLDADRRLICSTALGQLPQPVIGNYPVHTTRTGLEILNNVPLQMANQTKGAVIIQLVPFNVVLSPYATDDIYTSADAVWLRTEHDLILLASSLASEAVARLYPQAQHASLTDLKPSRGGYELTSVQPEGDLVLQTQRSPGAIMRDSGWLLPALLAGSLLIAVLAVGTLSPFVRRLGSLRNRIGFLCKEAHLSLVYQPIFDLTTLRPVGCEVLTRVKEGDRLWMPDEIIPAIMRSKLARRFDHTITRKAIRELATHLPGGRGKFFIALNYFPESIDQSTLAPLLTTALQATDRNDFEVCLEVTEHSLSSELIEEVQGLKAHGFLIAVDDFGTGYSNLKSVTRLSPDVLKVDRSFVFELEDATVRSNLIPEIVNIARAVQAQTVAEGIENLEQARLLAAAGVRYGQGYALARPMEMAQFITFLSRYH